MANLVKTTITLPEDLFLAIKMKAVREKTNVSAIIRKHILTDIRPGAAPASVRSMKGFIKTNVHRTEQDIRTAIAQDIARRYAEREI